MYQVDFFNKIFGLSTFVIEGENYSESGESSVVPAAVLKTGIDSILYNFDIEICESRSDEAIVISSPVHFKHIGKRKFYVRYEELITKKYWDSDVGLKLFMETKNLEKMLLLVVEGNLTSMNIMVCK